MCDKQEKETMEGDEARTVEGTTHGEIEADKAAGRGRKRGKVMENDEPIITVDQSIQIYTVFRQYLIHEDDLINQRTTWSLNIQAFIIVAFGLAFQNSINVAHDRLSDHEYGILILALATLDAGVSLICLISVRAAQIAIRGLCAKSREWDKTHPRSPGYPPLTGGGEYWATLGYPPWPRSSDCSTGLLCELLDRGHRAANLLQDWPLDCHFRPLANP
jgi:hypothetical protein